MRGRSVASEGTLAFQRLVWGPGQDHTQGTLRLPAAALSLITRVCLFLPNADFQVRTRVGPGLIQPPTGQPTHKMPLLPGQGCHPGLGAQMEGTDVACPRCFRASGIDSRRFSRTLCIRLLENTTNSVS